MDNKKCFPSNISKVGPTLTQRTYVKSSSKSTVTMKRVRRTIQKLVVLFVILVSIGLFFRQAIICIDRFVSKETQINLDILRLESLSSFSMTLTFLFKQYQHGQIPTYHIVSGLSIRLQRRNPRSLQFITVKYKK